MLQRIIIKYKKFNLYYFFLQNTMNTYINYSNNHKFGKIVHINELEKEPKKYIGETIRVLGK